MSLSDEELLFDTNQYVRMYGAVDDSNITSSGTFISSGSFEVHKSSVLVGSLGRNAWSHIAVKLLYTHLKSES